MHTDQSRLVRDSLLAVHSPDTYPIRTFSVPIVEEVVDVSEDQMRLDDVESEAA